MAGPSLIDSLLQRSLDDLIKSLRTSPPGTLPDLISKSIEEIRREIKATDSQTKSTALQKLTYLHSLHGIDISWAAFHSVELSSTANHSQKRIAYLSASLSFNPNTTDVILLLTHQLRKDLTSTNVHDVSLALSTLSLITNHDLSRDLTPELFALLSSGKFFIRKKAIAAVLRVFELYPESVRVCFKRVVDNLESSDMGVLSSAVGLLCELTVKDPVSYLPLAPEFYKMLVECRNNWVLIKVLKIFSILAPLEPRLGKKVVEPICEHMGRTEAKSLVFECVRTIVTSLSEYEFAVKLAVEKIKEFLTDDDSNLKYLGLQALATVAQKHLWAVLESKEVVIKALSDVDVNIKLEALRLIMSMVSEDNVVEICRSLIVHSLKSDPEFCNEILGFILSTCSRNFYEVIFDFDWYVSFLGEMARIPHCQKGEEIETQFVDIGMRVKDARIELVRVARELVIDPALLGNPFVHKVLSAAAWISGEYVELFRNPFEIMEALLQPRTSLLPPSVRAVYIQSAFKVLTFCAYSYLSLNEENNSSPSESVPLFNTESIMDLVNLVETNLGPLAGSNEVEVQERASNVLGLIKLIKSRINGTLDQSEGDKMIKLVYDAFSEELGPVSFNAQERVPVPDGLDLKENLNDLEAICRDFQLPISNSFSLVKPSRVEKDATSVQKDESEPSNESTTLLAEHRKRHGIYYLPSQNNKEVVSNDYPPANEPKDKAVDDADDLKKLTEQSFVVKKKSNQTKPRPVVVKLDDVEATKFGADKPGLKAGLISGAVQEVLFGNEAATSSSRKSGNSIEKDELIGGRYESKNDTNVDKSEVGSSRRKHRSSGKERKEHDGKVEKKSGKHKSRRNADGALNMAAQSPVIPDFLL